MRRILVLCIGMLLLLSGCSQAPLVDEAQADVSSSIMIEPPNMVVIGEKLFIAQVNDIYLNTDDYLGKTVKMEGMFYSSYYEPTDSVYCMVIRFGPGCCGSDGQVGFEVTWSDDSIEMPAEDDWVEVIGVLEEYEELGNTYLQLNLSSLTVLDVRGLETVTQ